MFSALTDKFRFLRRRTNGIQQPADVKVCRLCYILLVGESPAKIDDTLKMRMCAGLEYIQKQEVCRNDILESRKAWKPGQGNDVSPVSADLFGRRFSFASEALMKTGFGQASRSQGQLLNVVWDRRR